MAELIWIDDDHLQVGDTKFFLTLDWATADTTESTPDEFLLVKNSWLVETTLERLPERVDNMVECGIFKGGSVAMYEALFSPERFVALDRDKRGNALDEWLERRSATDRVRPYYATDQNDRPALEMIARENFKGEDRSLDLVIDDGAHRYEPCKNSLNVFLPLLRPGGVYIIEDWGWAHWPDAEFQEEAASRQYADQNIPLTKLIFEVVMLAASRPEIIQNVFIDSSRAFLTRGDEVIADEHFDISKAYMTSLWEMEFSARTPYVPPAPPAPPDPRGLANSRFADLWRTLVPLSVRKRVPSSLASFAHREDE